MEAIEESYSSNSRFRAQANFAWASPKSQVSDITCVPDGVPTLLISFSVSQETNPLHQNHPHPWKEHTAAWVAWQKGEQTHHFLLSRPWCGSTELNGHGENEAKSLFLGLYKKKQHWHLILASQLGASGWRTQVKSSAGVNQESVWHWQSSPNLHQLRIWPSSFIFTVGFVFIFAILLESARWAFPLNESTSFNSIALEKESCLGISRQQGLLWGLWRTAGVWLRMKGWTNNSGLFLTLVLIFSWSITVMSEPNLRKKKLYT